MQSSYECNIIITLANGYARIQPKELAQQELHFWLRVSAYVTLSSNFAHLFMRFAFGLMYLSTTTCPSLTASNEKEMCPSAWHKSTRCFIKVRDNCPCIFKVHEANCVDMQWRCVVYVASFFLSVLVRILIHTLQSSQHPGGSCLLCS